MGARETPEHQCRQDRRCKAKIRDSEGEWHGVGVERPDSLCRPCEEHAFADIRELTTDYLHLTRARTEERSKVSGPKVSGSSDMPIPIPLAVDTLMSLIAEETLRWAVRLTRGNPIPNDNAFMVITSNLGTLVDMPLQAVTVWVPHPEGGDDTGRIMLDGVDAVLRLAHLHYRAIRVLGLEPVRDQYLHEPCHLCGLVAVTASVRTNLVTCLNCRNVWAQEEFARLNNPLAAA